MTVMSTAQRIQPVGSTPAQRSQPRAIPKDLLREASRRLGVMALLTAVLWIVATTSYHFALRAMTHGDPGSFDLRGFDAIAGVSALVSLALFFWTRTSDRDPRFMLDVGLVYMVFVAFGIGMSWHWEGFPEHWPLLPQITWVGVVILIFPAIVPNTPARTLVAGLIAASMNPLGMLIARARGAWDFGPTINVLVMHYPDYLMVGVSLVVSRVVTGLGQQVARAREMGSYQLGELLGRGGMGEVYRATHRLLARPAAIKLIRPEMIGAGDSAAAQLAVRRFRREAEVAASLRSSHTVELYDFGVTEDETLYFVMELLEGMTLEELVRRHGPVPRAAGDLHPAAGVRIAGGGARARPRAPGHQAREHPRGPARTGARLRQGARLRARETRGGRDRRALTGDRRRRHAGNARRIWRRRWRWARRWTAARTSTPSGVWRTIC